MKKLIVILLLCLLLTGCKKIYSDYYSRSFVVEYLSAEPINIDYESADRLKYSIRFDGNQSWSIKDKGEKKQIFDALCEKYGDVGYNRRVRFWDIPYSMNPCCASAFTDLRVVSSAAWDDEHPAGEALDDIILFTSTTPLPYIRSGYTYLYRGYSEYHLIDKTVSELTTDDMTLLNWSISLTFSHAPTLAQKHTITVYLTDDEGKEYSASIKVDFDNI